MDSPTSNSAIETYLNDTIRLVRSLVVKSSMAAKKVNDRIIQLHGNSAVMQDFPETWKYYMNICGQYHSTDAMMKVISLDTHEEIDFTVENMQKHTATAQAYRHGSRYYYSLVRLYPDQVVLILGVTNPADMEYAISSADGTVLNWDRSLVEIQENTLIYDIEQYAKNYFSRYNVAGFHRVAHLYPVLWLSQFYMSLPAKIMNLRLAACKTEKTHSFHITQYLASHGRLDRFIPYLTLEQMLYLYHNITYLERNAGKTEVFEELVEEILTKRRIPLSEYTVRQLQTHESNLLPMLRARRRSIGSQVNIAQAEYIPMETYFDKEEVTQAGNARYFEVAKDQMLEQLATSPSAVIQTKDLESAMVDYTDAVPDTRPDVLLRQWVYMAAHGLYDVVVNFTNPISGQHYSLMAKDALIYHSYLFLRSYEIDVTAVPSVLNVKFRKHPRPQVEDLYAEIPTGYAGLHEIADVIVRNQPILTPVTSVTQFRDLAYKIYDESIRHWFIKANIHDPMTRGIVHKMVDRLYAIELVDLGDEPIAEWLLSKSLPVYDYTKAEADSVMKEIFQRATGYTIDDTKSLRSIQRALIELFTQLSSYSIQLMREINDSEILPLNWAAIRLGITGEDSVDTTRLDPAVRVLEADGFCTVKVLVNDEPITIKNTSLVTENPTVTIESVVDLQVDEVAEINLSINIPGSNVTDWADRLTDQQAPFHPMEFYDALSQDEITQIADSILKRKVNHG